MMKSTKKTGLTESKVSNLTSTTQPTKYLTTELSIESIALDKDGHLCDHTVWSSAHAQVLADNLDIELTAEHFQILECVRSFYTTFQHSPATRPLIKYLQKKLPKLDISNQTLQQMFNTGLVARHVNRLSGLPKPPNCL